MTRRDTSPLPDRVDHEVAGFPNEVIYLAVDGAGAFIVAVVLGLTGVMFARGVGMVRHPALAGVAGASAYTTAATR